MKIAFFVSASLSISHFNGILVQAQTWAAALEKKGHTVIRVNPWERQEWEEYDIIHIIGVCGYIENFTKQLAKRNTNIVFSPIIDTIQNVFKYKLATYWGSKKFRLVSPNYSIRQATKYIKHYFVRSQYELSYVNKAYSISLKHISIVPLSYRLPVCNDFPQKEEFCLHVSKITDGRKNVMRLVQAAIKYKFKLVLAGSISSEEDFVPIKAMINQNENITYLGRISDEELIQLYRKAKVFALPSINEGVGMVAIEAALYGCEIIITRLGGPGEYYNGRAYKVNPFSVDDIGEAILTAMYKSSFQPTLQAYIKEEYSLSHCMDKLLRVYESLLTK
jgi:glycosyltransferase involved in cell wall biosynthesis